MIGAMTTTVVLVLVVFSVSPLFLQLIVRDAETELSVRFWPISLVCLSIRYDQIKCVRLGSTMLLTDWMWNVTSRQCVIVKMDKRTHRIPSNAATHLVEFLESRKVPTAHNGDTAY